MQIGVQSIETNGVKGIGNISGNTHPSAARVSRVTPTGKLKELQSRLQGSNSNVTAAVQSLKGEGSQNSQMGFYLMIFGFVFMSYMFN